MLRKEGDKIYAVLNNFDLAVHADVKRRRNIVRVLSHDTFLGIVTHIFDGLTVHIVERNSEILLIGETNLVFSPIILLKSLHVRWSSN